MDVPSVMASVRIQIVRYVSDDQPGFVAGELRDAFGRIHTFEDKVPVIALANLTVDSDYPCDGVLDCEIIERWTAEDGRELARIDTENPWDIPSTDDEYHFVVLSDQISDET